jgi:hypothetical protein
MHKIGLNTTNLVMAREHAHFFLKKNMVVSAMLGGVYVQHT